jgi:hypothetical protein
MRMIVIKEPSDLPALADRLIKPGRPSASVALDRLRALNPHVDFARLDAGTVLLVPEHPDFEGGEASSIGGEAFASLAKDALSGLEAAASRIRAGFAQQDAQRKEAQTALRSAAFKRLAEGDEALRKQAAEVEARFASALKRVGETTALLAAMDKVLKAELDALARRLG